MTVGTWDQSDVTATSNVATLRYMYSVQEDIAHSCLMQMRIGTYTSPIFTWSTTQLDADNIYTFPTELAIVSRCRPSISLASGLWAGMGSHLVQ